MDATGDWVVSKINHAQTCTHHATRIMEVSVLHFIENKNVWIHRLWKDSCRHVSSCAATTLHVETRRIYCDMASKPALNNSAPIRADLLTGGSDWRVQSASLDLFLRNDAHVGLTARMSMRKLKARGIGRLELLAWLNEFLETDYTKVPCGLHCIARQLSGEAYVDAAS